MENKILEYLNSRGSEDADDGTSIVKIAEHLYGVGRYAEDEDGCRRETYHVLKRLMRTKDVTEYGNPHNDTSISIKRGRFIITPR